MSNYNIKRNLTNILHLHNFGCSAWMYMLPSRNPKAQHHDYTPWTTPESTSTKSCVLSRIRVLVILIAWHNCANAFTTKFCTSSLVSRRWHKICRHTFRRCPGCEMLCIWISWRQCNIHTGQLKLSWHKELVLSKFTLSVVVFHFWRQF